MTGPRRTPTELEPSAAAEAPAEPAPASEAPAEPLVEPALPPRPPSRPRPADPAEPAPTLPAGAVAVPIEPDARVAVPVAPDGAAAEALPSPGAPPPPLADLDAILDWARMSGNRIGYFAALYRHVEVALGKAVENGEFDDPDRLLELNSVFFGRYTTAVEQHRRGEPSTLSWLASFGELENPDLVVVQHLLLGMNAHINLDLSIAVAQTVPAADLDGFKPDFDRMNGLLASLVDDVLGDVSRVMPFLNFVSRWTSHLEDAVIGFSMEVARAGAWKSAVELASLAPAPRERAILDRDASVAEVGNVIVRPGRLAAIALWFMRLGQATDVRAIIDDLLD